jgi:hypothetical protein
MFDLNQAIAEWRRQMAAAGVKAVEVLNELENHLRDDVEQQMRSGTGAQQAFQAAVRRIGSPRALQAEFKKVRGANEAIQRKGMTFLIVVLVVFVSLMGAASFFKPEIAWGVRGIGLAAFVFALATVFGWRSVVRLFPSGRENVLAIRGLEAFTGSARQTLEFAQAEAPRFNHDFVGTEHLLLGLLQVEHGVVPQLLRRNGVDRETIRLEIEKIVGVGPAHKIAAAIPYTPRAQKALQLAAQEAKALNHAGVGGEHIFLGLIREGNGVAALILKNLGVQIERTREELLKELGPNQDNG